MDAPPKVREQSVAACVKPGGSVEHMRHQFGTGFYAGDGDIVWMGDRTPHEAVPATTTGRCVWVRAS